MFCYWFYEYINELLKSFLNSKIALKQTPTLKLGVTLVLTVTQAYVFANLRQVMGVPPHKHAALNLSDIPSEIQTKLLHKQH